MKDDVIKYEAILNKSNSLFEQLRDIIDKINENQVEFNELKNYYMSEEYIRDVEISNTTDKYSDVPCGVLSEDAVFDLIGESYDISLEMLETATRILKNH